MCWCVDTVLALSWCAVYSTNGSMSLAGDNCPIWLLWSHTCVYAARLQCFTFPMWLWVLEPLPSLRVGQVLVGHGLKARAWNSKSLEAAVSSCLKLSYWRHPGHPLTTLNCQDNSACDTLPVKPILNIESLPVHLCVHGVWFRCDSHQMAELQCFVALTSSRTMQCPLNGPWDKKQVDFLIAGWNGDGWG